MKKYLLAPPLFVLILLLYLAASPIETLATYILPCPDQADALHSIDPALLLLDTRLTLFDFEEEKRSRYSASGARLRLNNAHRYGPTIVPENAEDESVMLVQRYSQLDTLENAQTYNFNRWALRFNSVNDASNYLRYEHKVSFIYFGSKKLPASFVYDSDDACSQWVGCVKKSWNDKTSCTFLAQYGRYLFEIDATLPTESVDMWLVEFEQQVKLHDSHIASTLYP